MHWHFFKKHKCRHTHTHTHTCTRTHTHTTHTHTHTCTRAHTHTTPHAYDVSIYFFPFFLMFPSISGCRDVVGWGTEDCSFEVRQATVINSADSSNTVRVRDNKDAEWRDLITFPCKLTESSVVQYRVV